MSKTILQENKHCKDLNIRPVRYRPTMMHEEMFSGWAIHEPEFAAVCLEQAIAQVHRS